MCVKHYGYRSAIRILINEAVQSGTWEGNVWDVPCDYHTVMLMNSLFVCYYGVYIPYIS